MFCQVMCSSVRYRTALEITFYVIMFICARVTRIRIRTYIVYGLQSKKPLLTYVRYERLLLNVLKITEDV